MSCLWIFCFLISVSFRVSNAQQIWPFGGNCRVERRISSLQPCLEEIYRLATNDTVFWFGRDLDSRCDAAAFQNINDQNCYIGGSSERKTSVFERLYSVDPGTSQFQKYITVTYYSAEGNYTACGANFTMPKRTIDAQPDTPPVSPWFVRNSPIINFQVEANTQYTIIIMDGAYASVQAVLSHYPLPQVDYQYQPPINARNNTTPLVYLVYKENGATLISPRWTEAMQASQLGRKPFDLSGFARQNQLEGPIAMNILMLRNDPYSAAKLKEQGGPDFCPQFVGDALRMQNEAFIRQMDFSNMDMMLGLTFVSPPATFAVCCQSYVFGTRSFTTNPLTDIPVDPIMVRDAPSVTATRANPRTSSDSGRLFTIVAVDPTIPKNALSTTNRPYLQWLVVNAKEDSLGNLGDDVQVLKYAPTIPAPQSPAHTIYFFLFEQQGQIETKNIAAKYSDTLCIDYLFGRCLFRITDFIAENKLTLRAASWFMSVNDAYSRYWLIKSGQVEWDICAGQPGYQVPCPRPGEVQVARPARVSEVSSAGNLIVPVLLITLLFLFNFSH